ncbi:hypothetical protein, partial [Lactiplantibacillus plantarum]|uniref:hypothetical protein n=1 Tax=Lactiplantibacillus plantarum TaxID=1590 RepID=UPI002237CC32
MFKIKVLSDDMNDEDLVNVYHPEIEKFDFEDNLELDIEARKQRFADWSEEQLFFFPKLQEQISHTINPIKSVFSLIFIFYGLNLTGGSSGEKLFGCL